MRACEGPLEVCEIKRKQERKVEQQRVLLLRKLQQGIILISSVFLLVISGFDFYLSGSSAKSGFVQP